MTEYNDTRTQSDDLAPPEDAMEMLKADHRKVLNLFRQYGATNDQDLKRRVAEHVLTELELHAQLEETVFYPAFAARAYDEGERLVGGAFQVHQLFKDLIAELRDIADDEEFEIRFHELMDHVEQHMEEEEREMFPQAQALLADDMEEIREEMQERKREMLVSK